MLPRPETAVGACWRRLWASASERPVSTPGRPRRGPGATPAPRAQNPASTGNPRRPPRGPTALSAPVGPRPPAMDKIRGVEDPVGRISPATLLETLSPLALSARSPRRAQTSYPSCAPWGHTPLPATSPHSRNPARQPLLLPWVGAPTFACHGLRIPAPRASPSRRPAHGIPPGAGGISSARLPSVSARSPPSAQQLP